jgi:hypothetical protein
MKSRLILGGLLFTFAAPAAQTADVDVVSRWNTAALDAIRLQRTAPPLASRTFAIMHAAMYDAVNAITRTHEPYFIRSTVPASASLEAAASAAAHEVLVALVPAFGATFDALHDDILDDIPDGPQKKRGEAWGALVAAEILEWRLHDGAAAVVDPPVATEPGDWRPTPPLFLPYLLPQWGFVTPFALEHVADFRPAGPPALSSARWADDYNEVKDLGAAVSAIRTAEQSLIARFWSDGAGTETPVGHWNSIAQAVTGERATPLVDKARLFALLNVALADAAICAWDAKTAYFFWRPVTAIRNGDLDGNDETTADPAWTSFIPTPPFPDYVSGHSTFSGAAAAVLAAFFGTDEMAFTAASDFLPGVTRDYARFSAAAADAALSRLYGGIHYRSANEDGLRAGVRIGEWVFDHTMRPATNRSRR